MSDIIDDMSEIHYDDENRNYDELLKEAKQFIKEQSDVFVAKIQEKYKNSGYFSKMYKHFQTLFDNFDPRTFHTHNKGEWWSIYDHILEDLRFNLPIFLRDKHSYPTEYIDKAKKELKIECEFYDSVYKENSNKIEQKAIELWNNDIKELLLYVRLYMFYENFGLLDPIDEDEKEINKKYKVTSPLTPKDYKDLYIKANEYWAKWIDKYKQIGQHLWD